MKIPNLYTLSQFVDYIDSLSTYELTEAVGSKKLLTFYDEDHKKKCLIIDYNNFLKQPIEKGMFVCEVGEPIKPMGYDNWREGNGGADGIACVNYQQMLFKYEEAQKKVIFDGWSQSVYIKWEIINGLYDIDFGNAKYIEVHKANESEYKVIKTLHDLAEATNGELKLKNVEL